MKTSEFYEKYRTPEKVSIYSQTIISTCVDMINGKEVPTTKQQDLVNELSVIRELSSIYFNGLKVVRPRKILGNTSNYPDLSIE